MSRIKQRYVHFVIMFLITGIICLCPSFGQITPYGMRVLGVFIGVLYGWIFIDLIWPSIFGFVALGLTGVSTVTAALSSGFGNQQLLMILVTIVFAGALDESGLNDFISTWLLKKKIFRKNPWTLIAGILLIAYILGIFGAAMAAVFLLWAVVIRIAELCGFSKKDPLISFCIVTITITAFGGSLVMPFHGGALIYEGFFTQATGVTIAYVPFIIYGFVITALISIILFLTGKYLLRLDAQKFALPEEMLQELEQKQATKQQRISFIILLAFIAALLLPELLPGVPGMALLSKLGLVGTACIAILAMNFITVEEQPLIDLSRTFTKHVQWPLLLLLAVTFPLADAMKSADSGIMTTVSQFLAPLVAGMGVTAFMIVSMVLLGLITQVTHNIVLGAMFIPFLCPLCAQMGGNQITLWFMIYIILNAAYVTPAGSMQSAMVHGHEHMEKKYAYLFGIVNLVVTCLVLALVGIPLGNLLF